MRRVSRRALRLMALFTLLPCVAASRSRSAKGGAARPLALAKVLYINLDKSEVRRAHMIRMLTAAKLSAPFERWSATAGSSLSDDVLQAAHKKFVRAPHQTYETWRNTIGCRTSHLNLVSDLLEHGKGNEVYLVLEDDAHLRANFGEKLDALIAAAPHDWHVLRFACWGLHGIRHPSYRDATSNEASHLGVRVLRMLKRDGPEANSSYCASRNFCAYCGGAHAVIYRHEHLKKVLLSARRYRGYDCALGTPQDGLISYCLQTPDHWVSVNRTIPSTRAGAMR